MSARTYDTVLADIHAHPEHHRHSYDDLVRCCFVNGAIDLSLVEAHSGTVGRTNGGVRCDVELGPCACGAWHEEGEER